MTDTDEKPDPSAGAQGGRKCSRDAGGIRDRDYPCISMNEGLIPGHSIRRGSSLWNRSRTLWRPTGTVMNGVLTLE